MQAYLEVVEQQCKVTFAKRTSPSYHYSYRFTTIKNDKDESLNLHVSWLPRYGPQEMTLHLSHLLEECQPRIAIMTGICAGDVHSGRDHLHAGTMHKNYARFLRAAGHNEEASRLEEDSRSLFTVRKCLSPCSLDVEFRNHPFLDSTL